MQWHVHAEEAATRCTGLGGLYRRSRRLEQTTLTELSAMHAPAIQGGSWKCRGGNSTPAAAQRERKRVRTDTDQALQIQRETTQ